MNYSTPAISVLMTLFNAEAYLGASIESIQLQTFQDWEFIIVDDASTDRSLAIAESYAEKDSRIKIIRNAINKGQTRCLNQGLAEARGAWIARQDADDISHPERFEKQWQYIQKKPELALLGTNGLLINDRDKVIGFLDVPLTHELITWSMALKNPFLHTSVMFRTEVVRSLGGYDEHYQIAQDYDLWARIIQQYHAANLSERLISYRHLESSLSKSGKNKAFEEAHKISQREEYNSFGRKLQVTERLLLQDFREGLEGKQQVAFLKLYKNLQTSFCPTSKKITNDQQRLEAVHHLQRAGSQHQTRYGQLKEVMAAFLAAPLYTMQWLKSRFLNQNSE